MQAHNLQPGVFSSSTAFSSPVEVVAASPPWGSTLTWKLPGTTSDKSGGTAEETSMPGATEDSVVGLAGSNVVKASLMDCSGTSTEVTGGSFKEPSEDNPTGVAEVPPVVVAETTAKEVPGWVTENQDLVQTRQSYG